MHKYLTITMTLLSISLYAQEKSIIFPDKLLVSPFYASMIEPKIGFSFSHGKNNIRLDIGASRDLINVNESFSFGADFFTFTKLRGEENFHFPVEAVDYLFGLNTCLVSKSTDHTVGARFRFSHISAHMVDGNYTGATGGWRDAKNPHVYSREYFEVIPFYQSSSYRVYAGANYLMHVVPHDVKRWSLQGGLEYFIPFGKSFTPFVAYDLKTVPLDKTTVDNTFMAGIKLGNQYGSGFRIQYIYYSGKSMHGEYYNVAEKSSSIGFTIDF